MTNQFFCAIILHIGNDEDTHRFANVFRELTVGESQSYADLCIPSEPEFRKMVF